MKHPLARELKIGSETFTKVHRMLKDRVLFSKRKMGDRYEKMEEAEKQFESYIKEQDFDTIRKEKTKNQGVPDYVSVQVPYSYAMLMTAHTYYTSIFLSRNPVFQVAGRHGEGENQVQAVEALLDYQLMSGFNLPQLFVWLLDPGKYGFGVLGHYWDEERITTRKWVDEPQTFMGIPIPGSTPKRVSRLEETKGFEGHRFFNVRPQDFFPDPRMSIREFQRGEFVARYVEVPWNDVVEQERQGHYFNVGELRKARRASVLGDREAGWELKELPGSDNLGYGLDVPAGVIPAYEIHVRLYPNEWGLDTTDRLEQWVFTVSTTDVIFGAEPVKASTYDFPYDILTSEVEGYALFSTSLLERVKPMNDIMTWLLNSHFYNVRAALNNQFLVDPSRVVLKDLENPRAGKLIRLRPEAYGMDLNQVMKQFPVADVTRGHLSDMQMIEEIVQRVLGINDTVMGMVDQGGRKTATEVRSSTSYSLNRLKTVCEWFSATGFAPLTQKLVQGSQTQYDAELKLRIVGSAAQFSQAFLMVDPEAISGFYDFVPVDGTMPVDRYAQANLWTSMLAQAAVFPQVIQSFDMAKLFGWIASLAGLKNVDQFRIQTVPNQALMGQAAAGNVIPMGQAMKDLGRVPEPQQIPGMGVTG